MICNKCNAVLPDDAVFCEKCGASVQPNENAAPAAAEAAAVAAPIAPATTPAVTKKGGMNFSALIGVVAGVVFMLWGSTRLSDVNCSIYSTSFGGDFYTYCYRGIVEAANLLEDVAKGVYTLVTAIGTFMTIHFAGKLRKK